MSEKITIGRIELLMRIVKILKDDPALVLGIVSPFPEDVATSMKDIASAIGKHFPEGEHFPQPQDGWIKCADRLPENDGVYLCTLLGTPATYKFTEECDFEVGCETWNARSTVVAWRERIDPYAGDP